MYKCTYFSKLLYLHHLSVSIYTIICIYLLNNSNVTSAFKYNIQRYDMNVTNIISCSIITKAAIKFNAIHHPGILHDMFVIFVAFCC